VELARPPPPRAPLRRGLFRAGIGMARVGGQGAMSTMMAYPNGQMGQMPIAGHQQVFMVFQMPMVSSGGHHHGSSGEGAWVPMAMPTGAMPVADGQSWGNGENPAGMASHGHPQMAGYWVPQQPQQPQQQQQQPQLQHSQGGAVSQGESGAAQPAARGQPPHWHGVPREADKPKTAQGGSGRHWADPAAKPFTPTSTPTSQGKQMDASAKPFRPVAQAPGQEQQMDASAKPFRPVAQSQAQEQAQEAAARDEAGQSEGAGVGGSSKRRTRLVNQVLGTSGGQQGGDGTSAVETGMARQFAAGARAAEAAVHRGGTSDTWTSTIRALNLEPKVHFGALKQQQQQQQSRPKVADQELQRTPVPVGPQPQGREAATQEAAPALEPVAAVPQRPWGPKPRTEPEAAAVSAVPIAESSAPAPAASQQWSRARTRTAEGPAAAKVDDRKTEPPQGKPGSKKAKEEGTKKAEESKPLPVHEWPSLGATPKAKKGIKAPAASPPTPAEPEAAAPAPAAASPKAAEPPSRVAGTAWGKAGGAVKHLKDAEAAKAAKAARVARSAEAARPAKEDEDAESQVAKADEAAESAEEAAEAATAAEAARAAEEARAAELAAAEAAEAQRCREEEERSRLAQAAEAATAAARRRREEAEQERRRAEEAAAARRREEEERERQRLAEEAAVRERQRLAQEEEAERQQLAEEAAAREREARQRLAEEAAAREREEGQRLAEEAAAQDREAEEAAAEEQEAAEQPSGAEGWDDDEWQEDGPAQKVTRAMPAAESPAASCSKHVAIEEDADQDEVKHQRSAQRDEEGGWEDDEWETDAKATFRPARQPAASSDHRVASSRSTARPTETKQGAQEVEEETCAPSSDSDEVEMTAGSASPRSAGAEEEASRSANGAKSRKSLLAFRSAAGPAPGGLASFCAREDESAWTPSAAGAESAAVGAGDPSDRKLFGSRMPQRDRDSGRRPRDAGSRTGASSSSSSSSRPAPTLPAPSATAYRLRQDVSGSRENELKRSVNSLLNKICPENVDIIMGKIVETKVASSEELETVIGLIMKKAHAEPHYIETYADLVYKLKTPMPEFPAADGGKPVSFKSTLLNCCQNEFEAMTRQAPDLTPEELAELDPEEVEFRKQQRKAHTLANIKFIGHLFLRQLLTAKIIGSVISDLAMCESVDVMPGEHVVECICELLNSIGYTLESMPAGKGAVAQVCGRLMDLKTRTDRRGKAVYCKRIQFAIQDLLDTRAAGWTKKVFKAAAKTKEEIRNEQSRDLQRQAAGKGIDASEHVIAGARPSYLTAGSSASRDDRPWQEVPKAGRR